MKALGGFVMHRPLPNEEDIRPRAYSNGAKASGRRKGRQEEAPSERERQAADDSDGGRLESNFRGPDY